MGGGKGAFDPQDFAIKIGEKMAGSQKGVYVLQASRQVSTVSQAEDQLRATLTSQPAAPPISYRTAIGENDGGLKCLELVLEERVERLTVLRFSLQFASTVNRDNTVSWQNLSLQIERVSWRGTLAAATSSCTST
jgi:hypothetical protein